MSYDFIGISGVARVGKDTLFEVLKDFFYKNSGAKLKRFAFADKLKQEIDPILIKKYGISAFTNKTEEKNIIRGELVNFGKSKRLQSKGEHWWRQIQDDVFQSIKDGEIPVITDVRYCVYPNDEGFWVKQNGGLLVHLSRTLEDGGFVPPANDEEKENDPIVADNADVCLGVKTFKNPKIGLNDWAKIVYDVFYGKE